MNLRRLLHTSAIRLALRYALLYALLTTAGLGVLYWATSRFVSAEMEASLKDELTELRKIGAKLGAAKLIEMLNIEIEMGGEDQRYYLLARPDGTRIAGNIEGWPEDIRTDGVVRFMPLPPGLVPALQHGDEDPVPMVAEELADGSRLLIVQGTVHIEELKEFILTIIVIILIFSVISSLALGLFLGRTILGRIDTVNRTANAIVSGDFTRRIPLSGQGDEFDELAQHLNLMLMRIDKLITGMRRVTDNIAHDLRGPLSRLRNRLEVTLLEARSQDEYIDAMQQAIVDADGLLKTFNALLEIAQTEAGSFRGEWHRVDLSQLAQNLGELYQDLAEERGMSFALHIAAGVTVEGNRHLLAQAIRNLLENAIKYSADGAYLELSLERREDGAHLAVADHGPGIPEDQRATVLERFARLEAARNSPGSGLGLSLVKAVAELHRAELRLEDNHPGLRVTLLFQNQAAPASR